MNAGYHLIHKKPIFCSETATSIPLQNPPLVLLLGQPQTVLPEPDIVKPVLPNVQCAPAGQAGATGTIAGAG